MRMYLSSYRVGNFGNELQKLVGKPNAKVAVIANSRDWSDDTDRVAQGNQRDLKDMRDLGFEPELFDLKESFGKSDLVARLSKFEMVWVLGGNTFILVKAMELSGFDDVVEKLIKPDKLVYAGYSAAFCAVGPSLDGVELVDDINASADGYKDMEVKHGYGLVDFYPIVHFRSDHHESEDVEKEYEYVKSKGRKFKTFSDGDVYIVDGSREETLSKSS